MNHGRAAARFAAMDAITAERGRQIDKWGEDDRNDNPTWLGVLAEEFGEVAKAMLDSRPGTRTGHATIEDLKTELIQTAAVCVAWHEQLTIETTP